MRCVRFSLLSEKKPHYDFFLQYPERMPITIQSAAVVCYLSALSGLDNYNLLRRINQLKPAVLDFFLNLELDDLDVFIREVPIRYSS